MGSPFLSLAILLPPSCTLGPGELMGLIAGSSFFGKTILLILLVMSLLSWAVFIDKARSLGRIRNGHMAFWQECEGWLDQGAPARGMSAWSRQHSDLPLASLVLETETLHEVPAIRRAAERAAYLETENLERYLILLSTAVTISPFLGLLGTVWGIMSAFWDMSTLHSANLTVVAPGIAEALVTTIAGLSVAIPAVIFYNMLVRKIDLVANEMDRLRTILEEAAGGGRGTVLPGERDQAQGPDAHPGGRI